MEEQIQKAVESPECKTKRKQRTCEYNLRAAWVAAVPVGGLNVEFFLKVNLDSFSIGHSYDPNTVNVLGVVLGIVWWSDVPWRIVTI